MSSSQSKKRGKREKKGQQSVKNLGRIHQVVGKAVVIELASANLPPLDSTVLLSNDQVIGPIVDFIGSVKHPWAVAINKSGQQVSLGTKVKFKPVQQRAKQLSKKRSRSKGRTRRRKSPSREK